ncbi:MAG: GIY-YIG nuclease family protein [Bryobacterales bacterium]|nr:GIY-YIG nuclease family protein [Bryobacterales bacterium]
MKSIAAFLRSADFPAFTTVEGRMSVADLFQPHDRCGIYVLAFSDGELYIGQSVDIVKRFSQHRRVHQDIAAIRFKIVPESGLDSAERNLIETCERKGFRLRNITFSSLPPTESDFDLVMSHDEQARWLANLDYVDLTGPRVTNDNLRRKYSRKFRLLRERNGI